MDIDKHKRALHHVMQQLGYQTSDEITVDDLARLIKFSKARRQWLADEHDIWEEIEHFGILALREKYNVTGIRLTSLLKEASETLEEAHGRRFQLSPSGIKRAIGPQLEAVDAYMESGDTGTLPSVPALHLVTSELHQQERKAAEAPTPEERQRASRLAAFWRDVRRVLFGKHKNVAGLVALPLLGMKKLFGVVGPAGSGAAPVAGGAVVLSKVTIAGVTLAEVTTGGFALTTAGTAAVAITAVAVPVTITTTTTPSVPASMPVAEATPEATAEDNPPTPESDITLLPEPTPTATPSTSAMASQHYEVSPTAESVTIPTSRATTSKGISTPTPTAPATPTPTPTVMPSSTSPSASPTPVAPPSDTPLPTSAVPTATPTSSPSVSPTASSDSTPTPLPIDTSSVVETSTPSPTVSPAPPETPTVSPTGSPVPSLGTSESALPILETSVGKHAVVIPYAVGYDPLQVGRYNSFISIR